MQGPNYHRICCIKFLLWRRNRYKDVSAEEQSCDTCSEFERLHPVVVRPIPTPTSTHNDTTSVIIMNYTRAIGFGPALRRAAFAPKPRMFDYMHLSMPAKCCLLLLQSATPRSFVLPFTDGIRSPYS